MTLETPMPFEDYLHDHPEAGDLLARLRGHTGPYESLPEYLGHGVDKHAFRVGEHVMKLLRPRPQRPYAAQLRALQRAVGVPGAEQLVAASARAGVVVTEFVEGPQVMRLPAAELTPLITPESTTSLCELMRAFQERTLYVDSLSGIFAPNSASIAVIDPIDSPRDATNDPKDVMKAIIQWKTAPGTERIEARLHDEVAAIRDAFVKALSARK